MMTSSNGNIFRVTDHLCGEFSGPRLIPAQRPVTRSFVVFFDLRLNKRLSKQSWGWCFETLLCPLWRHRIDDRYFAEDIFKCNPLNCVSSGVTNDNWSECFRKWLGAEQVISHFVKQWRIIAVIYLNPLVLQYLFVFYQEALGTIRLPNKLHRNFQFLCFEVSENVKEVIEKSAPQYDNNLPH